MKRSVALFFLIVVAWADTGYCSEPREFPVLKGPYLGQAPPGLVPEIFAPGIISKEGHYDGGATFSADNRFFAFKKYFRDEPISEEIWISEQVGGVWARPHRAPFSGEYDDWDFHFAPFGNAFYFTSKRPATINGTSARPSNIWETEYTSSGWAEPVLLEHPVNIADGFSGFPSLTKDKAIYFHSLRNDGFGQVDIYLARLENDRYTNVENLGGPINTESREFDPCIAPDGSYLLFISNRPSESDREYDLYISFLNRDGSWSEPRGLGDTLGIDAGLPNITADGSLFFFTGGLSAGAEHTDIYWVDAEIFDQLRPQSQEQHQEKQ
jgi:hypothetical protein